MKTILMALTLMALTAPACTTEGMRRTEVANRSSLELRCPARTIQVVRVGFDSYVAVGCSKRAGYSLRGCHNRTVPASCQAWRTSPIRRQVPGAPLPRKYVPPKRPHPLENCCPVLSQAPR